MNHRLFHVFTRPPEMNQESENERSFTPSGSMANGVHVERSWVLPSLSSQPSRSGLKKVWVRSFPSSSGILKGSLRMLSYSFCVVNRLLLLLFIFLNDCKTLNFSKEKHIFSLSTETINDIASFSALIGWPSFLITTCTLISWIVIIIIIIIVYNDCI